LSIEAFKTLVLTLEFSDEALKESVKQAREKQQQKLRETVAQAAERAATAAPAAPKPDSRLELLGGKSEFARKRGLQPVERDSSMAPSFPARGRFTPACTTRR
jgi:hypothetical protein